MKNVFRDFFYFSKGERRGIIALIALIVMVSIAEPIYSLYKGKKAISEEEKQWMIASEKECEEFIASLHKLEKNPYKYSKYYDREYKTPVVLAPFNPNIADSITFRKLGLPAWMAENILHYRRKGGKFKKAEDFKKVYGLTEEQYHTLAPYIYIAPQDTIRTTVNLYLAQAKRDSVYKYPAGTIIELNSADTTELKKIPGIGSGIARIIANYRQRLGGFYRIEQLREIKLDDKQLQTWFSINHKDTHRINLNRVGIEKLRNHPYINFYQAEAIVEYRKKKGALNSLKPFALYEEFTADDIERISHYICFE